MQKPNDLNEIRCSRCNYKAKKTLALIDLKSSNQMKEHYFLQVAMYYEMFRKLTGIKIDRFHILKVSKTDGTYFLQEIRDMGMVIECAKHELKLSDGMDKIREMMKKTAFKI